MSAAGSLGVLVAGGRGRRLSAGHPKALASIAGRTLLERAMALLGSLCDEIVVCAPEEMELPIDAVRRVADPPGAAGPLAGLVAGLAARNFRVALALGVDLPLLRPEMLRGLLAQLGSHLAVLPAPEGVPQPLAAGTRPGRSLRSPPRSGAASGRSRRRCSRCRTCSWATTRWACCPAGSRHSST